MKRLAILGSTGSIGRNTLDVVARNRDAFRVVVLTAGRNIELLEQQVRSFRPEVVAVADDRVAGKLRRRLRGPEILSGVEGIDKAASYQGADFVICSIVGSAGLMPTVAAISAGKSIGLANKEALVMAGEIVMKEARRRKVRVIPVDSEHSAVFQCLEGRKMSEVRRIILTASGGPFFRTKKADMKKITVREALRHPNWSMGKKITIDSATLMNKGLEVIEACRLFGLGPEKVDVLVHPQSIVHSMVEFMDRSVLAQMAVPDMRGPISYALSYPGRISDPIGGLELEKIGTLTFRAPDIRRFPCLKLAYEAVQEGGTAPAVLNAANEVAVNAFLKGGIGFDDIPIVIRKTLDRHESAGVTDIRRVLEADTWARALAAKHVREIGR